MYLVKMVIDVTSLLSGSNLHAVGNYGYFVLGKEMYSHCTCIDMEIYITKLKIFATNFWIVLLCTLRSVCLI